MIMGLGIDIVEIDRVRRSIDRFGRRFIAKILHESELPDLACSPPCSQTAAARVASRFAAKEAGAKALGTGFSNGIGPRDIRVCSLPSGQPAISLHGMALKRANALGVGAAHLSLSHGRDNACAVVVFEGQPTPPDDGSQAP